MLPFYDNVSISRKQHAFRNYAETYKVEVVDRISLSDLLFLAKSSIIDLFLDLLKEKTGFKYILSVKVTLKRWNNEINTYDIDTMFCNSDAIKETNKRFDLVTAYETLKHRLSIYSGEPIPIPIPFKIYADTECLLKRININEGKYTKLYQKHTPNSLGAKLVCIDNRFTLPTIIFEGKNCINKFIKWSFTQQVRIN